MQSVGQVQSFAENNPERGEVGRGSYLDRPAVRGGVCGELIDSLVEMKRHNPRLDSLGLRWWAVPVARFTKRKSIERAIKSATTAVPTLPWRRSAAQGVLPVPDNGIICGALALSFTINFPFCGVLSGGVKVT
jgi:hypothetical protein